MAKQNFTPGTGMFYVGRRAFTFAGVTRESGTPVPEAFDWPKARALVSLGRLVWSPLPTAIDSALAGRLVELGWTPPAGFVVAPPVMAPEPEWVDAGSEADLPAYPSEPADDLGEAKVEAADFAPPAPPAEPEAEPEAKAPAEPEAEPGAKAPATKKGRWK